MVDDVFLRRPGFNRAEPDPMQVRPLRILLLALAALATAFWAAAQSQSTSDLGSYLSLEAQVVGPAGTPTLNSTTDVTGNDLVRWTSLLQSRLGSPFTAEGELTLPPGQTWVAGSLKLPPSTSLSWQVAGNWVASEPANGTAVTAVRWTRDPLYVGKQTVLPDYLDFRGTGDGERVIPFKDRFYVINHTYSTSGTDDHPFGCRMATTGAACPGFESGNQGLQLVAGTAIRGASTLRVDIAPIESVNYKTGRLYVPVTSGGSMYIACVDLTAALPVACESIALGESGDAPTGVDTIGSEYFVYTAAGNLHCIDVDRGAKCGSWNIGGSYDFYGADGKAIGTKLFVNDGSNLRCFDTLTRGICSGWPAGGQSSGGLVTNVHADRTGTLDGVCSSANRACYSLAGTSFSPSASFSTFMQTYAYWANCCSRPSSFKDGQLWSVSSTIGCFDFRTDAMCSRFATFPAQDSLPYTTRFDPTRANCLLVLGDYGVATMVDVTTGGACKGGMNGLLPDIDVDPASFYRCDPSHAQVRAWGSVRMSPSVPWGGSNGLTGVTVTIKNGRGEVLPAALNPVRQFANGSYSLSIADIPYADYPVLKLSVELKTPGALPADKTYGIDVTWDGDPAQVCVTTKMPAVPDCQMTANLKVSTRAIDSTSGTWQETQQVSKVVSPGGLSSGYAAFSSATTPRLNPNERGPLDPQTQVVQGRWALQQFTGDVWAFMLQADGQIAASSHTSAQSDTLAASSRPMFTAANPNGAASVVKSLLWSNLTVPQQDAMNRNLAGVADAQGPQRLDYLRGTDGGFRGRGGSSLGPVINSAPVVLPLLPQAGLSEAQFPGYAAYRQLAPRAHPLAIWGGNDGALHGAEVKGNGLSEAWAFVPDVMLRRAAQLADPDISGIRANPYFVDNVPMVGHVNAGRYGWRAVAVMTYGRGARAITALDVTESDLSRGQGVLFEYNNTMDSELNDLGYIISQPGTSTVMQSPQYVQLGSGKRTAVLVGNGISSNDGRGASGPGRAVLYAFYFDQSGAKRWHRWAVDELWAGTAGEPGVSTNNGLSTPTAVDTDGDGVTDTVYAGDLQGNLWRFDVRNPESVGVTRLFKTDTNQPITQAPYVVLNPEASGCGSGSGAATRCWQVVFSTGAAISPLQGSPNVSTQSIYSVLDKGKGDLVAQSGLVKIPFEANQILGTVEYRALKATAVNYQDGAMGWRVDLQDYEHGVGAPRAQPTGLVMFSSIRPTTPDRAINVCVGPRSWLNEVDPLHAVTGLIPFDTNGDGTIDKQDMINPTSSNPQSPQSMAVSGAQFGPPTVLLSSSAQSQQMSLLLPSLGQDTRQANSWSGGESGGSSSTGSNSRSLTHANPARLGRMSWREIY